MNVPVLILGLALSLSLLIFAVPVLRWYGWYNRRWSLLRFWWSGDHLVDRDSNLLPEADISLCKRIHFWPETIRALVMGVRVFAVVYLVVIVPIMARLV